MAAHPYEEPAFDIYPVEDVLPAAGLGRVGMLPKPLSVRALAERVAQVFEVGGVAWSGDGAAHGEAGGRAAGQRPQPVGSRGGAVRGA